MSIKCAIIGSGNIGTDLMIKILRTSDILELAALVGIDPDSDGLARAKKMGVAVTDKGIDGRPVGVVFLLLTNDRRNTMLLQTLAALPGQLPLAGDRRCIAGLAGHLDNAGVVAAIGITEVPHLLTEQVL